MLKSRKKQFGQGMTEYIIIVALIAVSAISVYNLFGKTVRTQVGDLAAELGGGQVLPTLHRIWKCSAAKASRKTGLADFVQDEGVSKVFFAAPILLLA